jgi:hypothetical protein
MKKGTPQWGKSADKVLNHSQTTAVPAGFTRLVLFLFHGTKYIILTCLLQPSNDDHPCPPSQLVREEQKEDYSNKSTYLHSLNQSATSNNNNNVWHTKDHEERWSSDNINMPISAKTQGKPRQRQHTFAGEDVIALLECWQAPGTAAISPYWAIHVDILLVGIG